MIENVLERLADAAEKQNELLETIASALTGQGNVVVSKTAPTKTTTTPTKPASSKPTTKPSTPAKSKPAEDTGEEAVETVTAAEVKELAKQRMAEGYLRSDLKKKIEELGADNIADLDGKGMIKFHAFLSAMGEDDI